MVKKRDILGLVGAASATIAVGASLFQKDSAARVAISASHLAFLGIAFDSRRRDENKRSQAEKTIRNDLRDHKILLKDLRNSEILKHRRLEKYVSDLAKSISKFSGMERVEKTATDSIQSQKRLQAPEIDLNSSFSNLSKRVAKNHSLNTGGGEGSQRQRVLFVSSNGAGLGHLTRLSAVDRRLDAETMFYTMSSAYHSIGKSSKDIIYFPSHGDLGMDGGVWNNYQEAHFGAVVEGFKPDAIVFDGTYIYRGIIRVARKNRIKLVWMQRGCWKPEVDQKSKQRHNAKKVCDSVIIPGDYGCNEIVALGEGIEATYVDPITLPTSQDLLDRETARDELGLPRDKKLFLVQLGAGVINDIDDLRDAVIRAVQSLGEDWLPVLVRNPLSTHTEHPEILSIQAYPLGIYYNAFDAGAFAAGYNTVQESIELGLPGLFIPNLETKTDDQLRRANTVGDAGLALVATDLMGITTSVNALSQADVRRAMRTSMAKHRRPGGAESAARKITELISGWRY